MSGAKLTRTKILNGLDLLAHKIAKLSLSAEIISPIYTGKINGKMFTINRETMPLMIIIGDAISYIYGRLGRCYFDNQNKDNNTASIKILFDEIFKDATTKQSFKSQYIDINKKLINARRYEKKLKDYCNKHFSHTDIKPLNVTEAELVKLNIPLNELMKFGTCQGM